MIIPRLNNFSIINNIVGYALPVGHGNSFPVCTRFVCKLFKISSKRLVNISKFQRRNWNQLPLDRRGNNINSHVEKFDKDKIRKHILSFPRYIKIEMLAIYLVLIYFYT